MKVERPTILHRKDERGVIVESSVFGPDDEIPEGFGAVEYTKSGDTVRESDSVMLAESKLTPWKNPAAPNTVAMIVGEPVEATDEALDELESDGDGDGEAPPRSGTGSGKEAWAAYAASRGIEVPEDATRDEIIDAVDEADRA